MALFAPFRVLGDVSSDVPFSTHKRGIETYATTASGRTFHIFDCKKLTLAMLGSMHEADVSLVCAKRDWTFTACSGRKIYCSRRVNVTCELVGHATEVKHLFAFGTLLVSIDRSEHVLVWDISEKVMCQTKRLSPLKVGVARNHRAAMQISLRHKSPLQALQIALQFIQAAS